MGLIRVGPQTVGSIVSPSSASSMLCSTSLMDGYLDVTHISSA